MEEAGYFTQEASSSSGEECEEGDDVGLSVPYSKAARSKTRSRTSPSKQQPKAKKKKLQDTINQGFEFLEQIEQYLKKELPFVTTNDEIDEKLKEQLVAIPDIEGCTDMTSLRRLLLTLSIEYSKETCPIFNCKDDTSCLMKYAQDPSIQNLQAVIEHYNLRDDCYSSILRSLIPPKLNILGCATELQLTTTHFSSLFELALLSKNKIFVNSNKQIPNMLNKKMLSQKIKDSMKELQVDAILAQKYNDRYITKIIREDKHEHSFSHFNHPDFLRVVFVMRLALSKNIRHLVKKDLESNIHDKLFILGMTTDNIQTNLYCMHANIKDDLSISYKMYTLGNFQHTEVKERAQLIHIILNSFSIPDSDIVETYLKHSKPSIKEPQTEKKKPQTSLVVGGLIIKLREKAPEKLCQTTKSLWKCDIINPKSNNSWKAFCKQVEPNSSDSLIGNLKFLTLFITRASSGEIILLEGEKVETISDPEEIISLTIDLLVQLYFLKNSRIIHNDLKPQNIVKYDNHYFIIDYGLSIEYASCDGDVCKDFDQNVITSTSGSPSYDSPEKRKHGSVSPKSDLFSLGRSISEIINESLRTDIKNDMEETHRKQFNMFMKELILNMTKKNNVERWTVEECITFVKSLYPIECRTSVEFFKQKEKYRTPVTDTDDGNIFGEI
ncbi:predicted protein [Naegleria gruberi]|uniref:Predicted protein n=1 Tax=Naegleria gruberi TaxID=5762 RepID=D2V0S2_NAEGR|nr:uncharacterized protein NAEGRDRAFT_62395 [Naegleria gruberi]EFC49779.1 predicted protein [Naegleria gruberi]|eukprot:XP_002682523.1 predicted protein [Naegleria gruberi strain NEG-M]